MSDYDSESIVTVSIADADLPTVDLDLGYHMLDMSDDVITINTDSTGKVWDPSWDIVGNPLDFTLGKPTITIGDYSLTEEKLERLEALLDVLDDDPDFKEKISNQIAFNRLKK